MSWINNIEINTKALTVGYAFNDYVTHIYLGIHVYPALCCVYLTPQTSPELLSFWNSGLRGSVNVGLLTRSTPNPWFQSSPSGVLVERDDISWLLPCKVFSILYRFLREFLLFEILLGHVLFDHFVIPTLSIIHSGKDKPIATSSYVLSFFFLASLFMSWALGSICRHLHPWCSANLPSTISSVAYPGTWASISIALFLVSRNSISFFLLSNVFIVVLPSHLLKNRLKDFYTEMYTLLS